MTISWKEYQSDGFFDELVEKGKARPAATELCKYLASLSDAELLEHRNAAELAILVMGITFTVYSEGSNIDRAWPLDIIPRIIPKQEWDRTEQGLVQRLTALNMFINDIYGEQKIIKDKIFPLDILANS